jgi:hypothetical protein
MEKGAYAAIRVETISAQETLILAGKVGGVDECDLKGRRE